jgi:predicted nicotinamide N-methyase
VRVGEVELSLLRPRDPEALIDAEAFAHDEFLPYWAELWPAGLALARALPELLGGVRIVELGCGLGIPSLVAAARGAYVTATDWAQDAIGLLRENAARNSLSLQAEVADWRAFAGSFELVLGADLLYERRNVEPLLELLPNLGSEVLIAEPGRPAAPEFLYRAGERWEIAEVSERVYQLLLRTTACSPGAC